MAESPIPLQINLSLKYLKEAEELAQSDSQTAWHKLAQARLLLSQNGENSSFYYLPEDDTAKLGIPLMVNGHSG